MKNLRFDDTLKINTFFGTVNVTFIKQYIDDSTVVFGGEEIKVESHYYAEIIDGSWIGHNATSIGSRETAVSKLIGRIASIYALDEVRKSVKVYEEEK